MSITFTVPGDPVPKGRPRSVVSASGRLRTYTPRRTQDYEAEIGAEWIAARKTYAPFGGPVSLLIAVFEKRHPADLDNYVKVVLDALNGLAFEDDKQVEELHATIERKADTPGITVTVSTIEEVLSA